MKVRLPQWNDLRGDVTEAFSGLVMEGRGRTGSEVHAEAPGWSVRLQLHSLKAKPDH